MRWNFELNNCHSIQSYLGRIFSCYFFFIFILLYVYTEYIKKFRFCHLIPPSKTNIHFICNTIALESTVIGSNLEFILFLYLFYFPNINNGYNIWLVSMLLRSDFTMLKNDSSTFGLKRLKFLLHFRALTIKPTTSNYYYYFGIEIINSRLSIWYIFLRPPQKSVRKWIHLMNEGKICAYVLTRTNFEQLWNFKYRSVGSFIRFISILFVFFQMQNSKHFVYVWPCFVYSRYESAAGI